MKKNVRMDLRIEITNEIREEYERSVSSFSFFVIRSVRASLRVVCLGTLRIFFMHRLIHLPALTLHTPYNAHCLLTGTCVPQCALFTCKL